MVEFTSPDMPSKLTARERQKLVTKYNPSKNIKTLEQLLRHPYIPQACKDMFQSHWDKGRKSKRGDVQSIVQCGNSVWTVTVFTEHGKLQWIWKEFSCFNDRICQDAERRACQVDLRTKDEKKLWPIWPEDAESIM